MPLPRRLLTAFRLPSEWWLALILLLANAWFLFGFLRAIPYPVGDDPGLHTTLVGELLRRNTTKFEIPIFPQVHTPFPARSATALLGWKIGHLFHLTDPLVISIGLAAGLFALSTLLVFWLAALLTGEPLAALAAALFWGWAHWGQEVFWEGGYDQITSLPLYFGLLIALVYAYRKPRWPAFLAVGFFLAALFKLHQLTFFVGLVTTATSGLLWAKTKLRLWPWSGLIAATIIGLGLAFRFGGAYFPLIKTGIPINTLLSVGEGIHQVIPLLMIAGLVLLVTRYPTWVTGLILVPILISQAGLLDFGFYPFRFNVYAVAALALLIAFALSWGMKYLRHTHALLPLLAFLFVLMLTTPLQARYDFNYRHYLTDQQTAPASIILDETYRGFLWIRDHLPADSNIAAPYKWGYYLAAVSGRKVTLNDAVGGDSRDNRYPYAQLVDRLYRTKDAHEAADLAHQAGVTHVFLDASFRQNPDRYPDYQLAKFADQNWFQPVYSGGRVVIYEVH